MSNNALKIRQTDNDGVEVNHRNAAQVYDGGEHKSKTYVKHPATMASWPLQTALEILRDMCSPDYPDKDLIDMKLTTVNCSSAADMMKVANHPVFKTFFVLEHCAVLRRSWVSFPTKMDKCQWPISIFSRIGRDEPVQTSSNKDED